MEYSFEKEGLRSIPDTFYPVEKLKDFTHMGTVKTYAKGSTIVFPDDENYMLIYVLSGRISVSVLADEEKEKLIYYTGENGIICARMYHMDNDNIYIVATQKSKVCYFSEEQLSTIFSQDNAIIFEIIKSFISKVRFCTKQNLELTYYNPTNRILRLLHEVYLSNGILVGDSYEICINLSLKFISQITGAHYVTVCRVLGYLKKQKIVEKIKTKLLFMIRINYKN
jgi:Cyclic nucleotide-binding domain.